MRRILALAIALITLYMPASHELLSESPTAYAAKNPVTKTVTATFYSANCYGCSGITASGYSVKRTIYYRGYRIIAADRSIPLGTRVDVKLANGQRFKAIALDRGGAIRGNKIDVLVASNAEAYRLGRQTAKITIY